jgi:hypothetical protein
MAGCEHGFAAGLEVFISIDNNTRSLGAGNTPAITSNVDYGSAP